MASLYLPYFPSSTASSCCSSSSSSSSSTHQRRVSIVCSSKPENNNGIVISRRSISVKVAAAFVFAKILGCSDKAKAAILEADDDEELMEKVKKDRRKRLEKQGVIKSATKETAYLQNLVYKLSEIGEAIEKNDLSTASSVIGSTKDTTDWLQKANSAFDKLSSSEEEKVEVDAFNSSLSSLRSSVSGNDIEGSKLAFVSCASAFEKWTVLSGLVEQLKGL